MKEASKSFVSHPKAHEATSETKLDQLSGQTSPTKGTNRDSSKDAREEAHKSRLRRWHELCTGNVMRKFIAYLRVSALALVSIATLTPKAEAQFHSPPGLYEARRSCSTITRPRYIPGHYQISHERVYVPGAIRRVFVPARYVTRCGLFGIRYRRVIEPAHYQSYREPGRYELRKKKAWIPGHYIN